LSKFLIKEKDLTLTFAYSGWKGKPNCTRGEQRKEKQENSSVEKKV